MTEKLVVQNRQDSDTTLIIENPKMSLKTKRSGFSSSFLNIGSNFSFFKAKFRKNSKQKPEPEPRRQGLQKKILPKGDYKTVKRSSSLSDLSSIEHIQQPEVANANAEAKAYNPDFHSKDPNDPHEEYLQSMYTPIKKIEDLDSFRLSIHQISALNPKTDSKQTNFNTTLSTPQLSLTLEGDKSRRNTPKITNIFELDDPNDDAYDSFCNSVLAQVESINKNSTRPALKLTFSAKKKNVQNTALPQMSPNNEAFSGMNVIKSGTLSSANSSYQPKYATLRLK